MKKVSAGALLFFAASGIAQTTITIDAAANRKAINPLIYGTAFGSTADLNALNAPLNRSGGNAMTRYNWFDNATNRAVDWYFQTLPEASATPGELGDTFIQQTRAGGAEPLLTIPMIGWAPKLGPGRARLSSFSIAKYGAQTDNDWQWFPDAGNGVSAATNQPITWHDPNDANMPADSTFQNGWFSHLVTTWGRAGNGGLHYYCMDNEASIWHSTHRDVHPLGQTMEEYRDKLIDYGTKIRANDPGATLLAPEEWGWSGFFYSGYDQQYGPTANYSVWPDREAHANYDYVPWLLREMERYERRSNARLLDYLTLHYYPQGDEFSWSYATQISTPIQQKRNRSTRDLWDPAYPSESWIAGSGPDGGIVKLIPRMRAWIDAHYPGTKLGITEYNWGAEGDMNGATAQADILGIFGREGVDLATRWTTPDSTSPTFKAMQMYRNYNGLKSTFGDWSVSATVPNADNVSAFAAIRSSDGALTVMLINKVLGASSSVNVNLANYAAASQAEVWRLATNAITREVNAIINAGSTSLTLPAKSVTLLVIPVALPVAPTVSSFAPQTGAAGTSVTIQGAQLSGTYSVQFNGVEATSFSVQNIGGVPAIVATVPSGATSGPIRVATPGGSGSSANPFNACVYAFTQIDSSYSAAGGAGALTLTTTTPCSWSITTPPWVQMQSATSGNGTSSITFNVTKNRDTTRCGAIKAGSASHVLTQAAAANPYVRGDFNSDGKPDLVWRNYSTGDVNVWLMNGATYVSGANLFNVASSDWRIEGTGDFNGDGKSDLVWRNYVSGDVNVWFLNGTTYTSGATLFNVADPQWHIEAVGDLDNDGHDDLLWRNYVSGAVNVWYLTGATYRLGASLLSVADTNWKIQSLVDLDRDGQSDLLWRNYSTGAVNVWRMSSATYLGGATLFSVTDPSWRIEASADFNDDDNVDLIWRNYATGAVNIWYLDRTRYWKGASLFSVASPSWEIAGPQ